MTGVYVAAGSNVDARRNIRLALATLRRTFRGLRVSRVYQNAAVGFAGDDFINLVVGFDTTLSLKDLVGELRRIEVERTKAEKWNGALPTSIYAGAPIPFLNVSK